MSTEIKVLASIFTGVVVHPSDVLPDDTIVVSEAMYEKLKNMLPGFNEDNVINGGVHE